MCDLTQPSSRTHPFDIQVCEPLVCGEGFLQLIRQSLVQLVICVRMADSVSSAIADIRKLAKASGLLEKNSEHQLATACEASKEMLKARAKGLVEAAGRGALLTSKSCGGAPLVTTVHTRAKMSSGEKVSGHGRAGKEFLVSNQFFRSRRADGSWDIAVTLSEPVVLDHGKSANVILEASRVGWKTLRQMGHLGPAVEHYCWDRAGYTALERLTRQ